MSRYRLVVIVVAAVVAVTAGAFVGLRRHTHATRVVAQYEKYASPEHLFNAADVVVVGTVTNISPGRVIGEGETALAFANVTVRVDERMKGSPDKGTTLTVVQVAPAERVAGDTAAEYAEPAGESVAVGEQLLLFLEPTGDRDRTFSIVSDQGQYVVRGNQLIGLDRGDPVVNAITSRGLANTVQMFRPAR